MVKRPRHLDAVTSQSDAKLPSVPFLGRNLRPDYIPRTSVSQGQLRKRHTQIFVMSRASPIDRRSAPSTFSSHSVYRFCATRTLWDRLQSPPFIMRRSRRLGIQRARGISLELALVPLFANGVGSQTIEAFEAILGRPMFVMSRFKLKCRHARRRGTVQRRWQHTFMRTLRRRAPALTLR
jgi:hypothetical protein